jgi:hypothetical protein
MVKGSSRKCAAKWLRTFCMLSSADSRPCNNKRKYISLLPNAGEGAIVVLFMKLHICLIRESFKNDYS